MLQRQGDPAWTRCVGSGAEILPFIVKDPLIHLHSLLPPLCGSQLLHLLRPYSVDDLEWHPVTTAMSKLGYDKPDSCEDVRKKKGAITSFFTKSPPAAKRPAEGPLEDGQEPSRKTAFSPAAGAINDDFAAADEGGASVKEEEVQEEGQKAAAGVAAGAKCEAGQEVDVIKPELKEEGVLKRQVEQAG